MHSHSPSLVSPRPAVLAAALLVALAGAGTAHALGSPGAAAGAVTRYHPPAAGAQHQADIATGADGNVVAVWYTNSPIGSLGVRARRLDGAGDPVGSEIVVNSSPQAGSHLYPSIAADADGNFTVVWTAHTTVLYSLPHVYQRRFDRNGVALGPQQQIDTNTPEAGGAVVAMSADGKYVAAWRAYPSTGAEIRARRFDAAGNALGSEVVVVAQNPGYFGPNIRLAVDDAGNFTVVWTHDKNDGAQHDVYRRRFDAFGNARGPAERLNYRTANGDQRVADIGMDANGNSVVVWDSYISRYDSRIQGQRYDANGTAVGSEFTLAYRDYATEEPTRPAVAMARATGEFSVAWQRRGNTMALRRYLANGTARGPEMVISDGTRNPSYVAAASDADGDITAVWQIDESYSSQDYGVSGRRFAGYGSIDLAARLMPVVESANAPTAVDYQIRVDNLQMPAPQRGVGAATGIVAVFTPPAGGVVLDAIGANWLCDTSIAAPRCVHTGVVAAGANSDVLHVRVGGAPSGTHQANVQVSGSQYDAQAANDGAAGIVTLP
ncbi:MAG TPA: hypothetical protein VLF18_12940 [Tahibacter sp.]|uniref:hypothetical protein n=1 Tax=Tahibacter sp. TaxID=2056211 RepID=UPI002C52651E|nr:hypothetical protein [Tahibacter sp.]HSX61103.1 hypothetical protein [Tahibacter sp.]